MGQLQYMITIILLSVLGAILSAVVGTFWYSPMTPMGRLHMREVGFEKLSPEEQKQKIEAVKPHMWKSYLGQVILSLLTSLATVFILTMSVRNGLPFSAALGFVLSNWLCFMVPVIGSGIIWGGIDRAIAWKKFLSEIGANLVTLFLITLLAYFFIN